MSRVAQQSIGAERRKLWVGHRQMHPWNVLGKFALLCHPWKFGLFNRFDCLFVGRLQRVFQSLQCLEVGVVLGVLDSEYGVPQFLESINDGVRRCDCRLRDVPVLEEYRVG